MEKRLYPTHPVRCITTGPNECGKSVISTNLILNIIKEYDKIYIHSPSLHKDVVIAEIVSNKDFPKFTY